MEYTGVILRVRLETDAEQLIGLLTPDLNALCPRLFIDRLDQFGILAGNRADMQSQTRGQAGRCGLVPFDTVPERGPVHVLR